MKRFATLAVVLALVASSAFTQAKPGGLARQIAMGGSNAGYNLIVNPFIMEDPSFMYLNPAYQTMYKDYTWINIGGGTLTGLAGDNGYGHQDAGINFSLNNAWTVGAILSHDPSAINAAGFLLGSSGINQRTLQTIPPVGNIWEAVASFDGGNFDVGFAFMYGNSNFDSTLSATAAGTTASYDAEASSSVFGFRAGVFADLGGGNAFDGSAALRLDKATDMISRTPAGAPDGKYTASATEMQISARLKLKVSNKVNFVPYGSFLLLTGEPKEDTPPTGATPTTTTAKVNATAFAVGVGGEYQTPTFYLAGGLTFHMANVKLESTTTPQGGTAATTTVKLSTTGLPVFHCGGEYWFTDWLSGRAGYYRSMDNVKLSTEANGGGASVTTESHRTLPNSLVIIGGLGPANFDGLVTLGIGLKFGGFSLDATLPEEALRRGLGLIGSQDNINTFGFINASYNFE